MITLNTFKENNHSHFSNEDIAAVLSCSLSAGLCQAAHPILSLTLGGTEGN